MASNVTTRSIHGLPVSTPAQPRLRPTGGPWRRVVRMLAVWYDRESGRRQLARLDGRALRDIGITQAQANVEVDRPFWQG